MLDKYLQMFATLRTDKGETGTSTPLRSLMERGVVTALSSDTPVMDPNPLHGLYAAVAHKTRSGRIFCPEEKVDLLSAIRAYTFAGAYASFEEGIKGSIERESWRT